MAKAYEYYLRHWKELETNIAADPGLAFLEPLRAELQNEENGLRNTLNVQAAGLVQAREGTRTLEDHVKRGNALMVRLHDLIRGHFGRDAEKLKQFQINPRRTKTKPRVAPEPPPLPEDVESGPNPTQTTASETDGKT